MANREVILDQRDLIGPDGPTDLAALAQRQLRARDETWQLLEMSPDAAVTYYGIAHVPLAFHMGSLLGTHCSAYYAERDRDRSAWLWMEESDAGFPALERRDPSEPLVTEDVAIAISVSYAVRVDQISASVGAMPIIELSVRTPDIDVVRTKRQVEAYSSAFRDVLEHLARVASVKRIHLFAATSMTIAFALGRQIRPTVHPDVHAYNYFRSATRPYPWGIRLRDMALSPRLEPSPRVPR